MATAGPHEERPQAGPLPSKRGEIGYQEEVHEAEKEAEGSTSNAQSDSLPARHPADTPLPPTVEAASASAPSAPTEGTPSGSTATDERAPRSPSPTSSVTSTSKLASFFNSKRVPTVGGLRATTLGVFFLQILILGGTIGGWVALIQHMSRSSSSSSDEASQAQNNSNANSNDGGFGMGSALIFVYIAFGVMVLVQIVFLERTTFRLRAERYAHVHPGEILPRHRNERRGRPGIGFVPWNRLSLPTYAAALAQSGAGTGDVEDNIIAVPPPPAYGDTRASTLLLAGATADRLRRIRESTVTVSNLSWVEIRTGDQGDRIPDSRPVSYMSSDPAWEERLDADAAARLEETLSKQEGDVTDAGRLHEERH